MKEKHSNNVLSSYSDISKISSSAEFIHFRKFISKKMVQIVLEKCPNLIRISLSRYAQTRLSPQILEIIEEKEIVVETSNRGVGRPNVIERMILNG